MNRRFSQFVTASLTSALVLGAASTAMAHPGHGEHSLADGFTHPLLGLDHLLAMVAVGLLAVRMGGRARWAMPATFMLSMLAGGMLAASGVKLPVVEYAILSSVLVLGVLVAATRVVPLSVGAGIIALFAVFHGYAHAAEMSATGSMIPYAAGLLVATGLLHTAGVAGGIALAQHRGGLALRATGGLVAALGLLLWTGVL